MKEIKAIIQPFKLDDVILALREHPELPGVTVSDVVGFGRQHGDGTPEDLGRERGRFGFAKKVKLEIVVPDKDVELVQETIHRHARTGNPGDGLIFVSSVESVDRIRPEP